MCFISPRHVKLIRTRNILFEPSPEMMMLGSIQKGLLRFGVLFPKAYDWCILHFCRSTKQGLARQLIRALSDVVQEFCLCVKMPLLFIWCSYTGFYGYDELSNK